MVAPEPDETRPCSNCQPQVGRNVSDEAGVRRCWAPVARGACARGHGRLPRSLRTGTHVGEEGTWACRPDRGAEDR
jgi:hypothetical protein